MQTPTSAHNPALKEIRKAIARGSQTSTGLCVAEGVHLLDEALRSHCEIDSVYATAAASAILEPRLRDCTVKLAVLTDSLFHTIATTETSQGVIALVRPPHWSLSDLFRHPALVLALDRIQDPGNAGAMLRVAEAFGASGLVFLKGSVNPYNPKALRAAAGSTFRIPLAVAVDESDLLDQAKENHARVFALAPSEGTPLDQSSLGSPCVLIVGNEGRGISTGLQQRANHIRIPTIEVESLNAAMAATVALYEARRQRTSQRTAMPL